MNLLPTPNLDLDMSNWKLDQADGRTQMSLQGALLISVIPSHLPYFQMCILYFSDFTGSQSVLYSSK